MPKNRFEKKKSKTKEKKTKNKTKILKTICNTYNFQVNNKQPCKILHASTNATKYTKKSKIKKYNKKTTKTQHLNQY